MIVPYPYFDELLGKSYRLFEDPDGTFEIIYPEDDYDDSQECDEYDWDDIDMGPSWEYPD